MPDNTGRLTRAEILEKVKGGESVTYHPQDGRPAFIISTEDQIPEPAEFAKGNDEVQGKETAALQSQIDKLNKQLADVKAANAKPKAEETKKPEEKPEETKK